MLDSYRGTGADLPFGDLCRAHGVAMEGYFWRLTDAAAGRVIVALCGVSRAADGVWANVGLAGHPGGYARSADLDRAGADPHRLGVWAGDGAFVAGEDRLRVNLGPDACLDVRIETERGWPQGKPFGGCGPAHVLPGLGQYWHPHVLGGHAHGTATLGDEVIEFEDADVYAEKNWGRGGFPERWWWGQAQGFARRDVCVAFAGGDVALGPASLPVTALVVRLGTAVIRLGNPLLAPVRTEIDERRWALRARGPVWSVELEGTAVPGAAHVLDVPLPADRRSVPGALEHLGARLEMVVRRRGRIVFQGSSALAGLELGGLERAAAELDRRGRAS